MKQDIREPAAGKETYPVPLNELSRIRALAELDVFDTAADEAFEALVRQAARVCETPYAMISFVDRDRQWSMTRIGFALQETPRSTAFCTHAILGHELFLVHDAHTDQRFANNPLVTGDVAIRFYAGMPLVISDGLALGTLCVMDRVPRWLDSRQIESLRDLAGIAGALLKNRKPAAESVQSGLMLEDVFEEIIVLCPDSRHIEYANEGALVNLGYRLDELQRLTFDCIGADYPMDKLAALGKNALLGNRLPVYFEAVHTRKDGSTYPVEVRATMSSSPVSPRIILLANDIFTRKWSEATMRRRDSIGHVTPELSSRQSVESSLKSAMQRVRRRGGSLALVMLEIGGLTDIRHVHGQQVADLVMADVARRLIIGTATKDLVMHLGGDDFAILIEEVADATVIPRLTDVIRRSLRRSFISGKSQIALSTSIGAVYFAGGVEDAAALLDRAAAAVDIGFLDGTNEHLMPLSSQGTSRKKSVDGCSR